MLTGAIFIRAEITADENRNSLKTFKFAFDSDMNTSDSYSTLVSLEYALKLLH